MAFFTDFSDKKQRGESPFANLCIYLFISSAVHIFVFIFFSDTIYLQQEDQSNYYRLTAKITTKANFLAPNAINKSATNAASANSIAEPPAAPQKTSSLSPTSDFPYFANELDTQPEPLGDIELRNIFESDNNQTGKIELLLLISSKGIVLWGIAEHSDYTTETTEHVISLFKEAMYKPATKEGHTVNTLIRIEVNHVKELE